MTEFNFDEKLMTAADKAVDKPAKECLKRLLKTVLPICT